MEIYQRFMKDLDGTGKGFSKSVSEVDVTDPEDVKALVATAGSEVLVHFGDEQFLGRYNEFEKHLPEWKQQYPKLASADMRYEGQIVLEMRKDGGDLAAAPAQAAPLVPVPTNEKLVAQTQVPNAGPRVPSVPVKAKVVPVSAKVKTPAKGKPAVAKKPAAKKVAGKSAANEKMYAALAAQRRAAEARSSGGGTQ
jgi:cell division protein FtsQ